LALVKDAREASGKADDIENAVYDLKAVNPNRKAEVDLRTPLELLDLIEAAGRDVEQAVTRLRALADPSTTEPRRVSAGIYMGLRTTNVD
jgi:hypothetical protein